MCTVINFTGQNHYFCRNLDVERNYGENVIITPQNYVLEFKKSKEISKHYAITGIGTVVDKYPLYYDGVNEKGLAMAGLRFTHNIEYKSFNKNLENITPFEFIPYILANCCCVEEAEDLISNINLVRINFSDELPLAPLHWIIGDNNKSIVVESVKEGLKVYNNPVGVLTNNPDFRYHLTNLNNYINLTSEVATNRFSHNLELTKISRGMGTIGLPGDLTSVSRFVRAAFNKYNFNWTGKDDIEQCFHLLKSVEQQRGCTKLEDGSLEYTWYSSVCDCDKGIYYYSTYGNSSITAVDMNREDLKGNSLIKYPLITNSHIIFQN